MNSFVNYNICNLSNRVRTNLLVFGYAKVNSSWNGTVLSPVYSRLYYFVSGSCAITPKNGEKIAIKPGKWYLFPAGLSFDYECEKEMEHYYFHLKLCDFDGTDLLRNCKMPLCIDGENENIDYLKNLLQKKSTIDGLCLKQTALSKILGILEENHIDIKIENYSPCVMKAITYIKDNLSVQLTINEIAENIFVSKSTLTKHFQKELSMSVSEYIYDLVMSGAEHLLSTGDEQIQTISEKYGFYDQFYFSKKFKEKFGMSPRNYRKNKPW